MLPLPEVDPNTLPKLVEGELKLWLPARDPSPADLSDTSLFLELNRLSHLRFGPTNKFDFCLYSAAFTNLSFYWVDIRSASSKLDWEFWAGESYQIDLNEGWLLRLFSAKSEVSSVNFEELLRSLSFSVIEIEEVEVCSN